MSANQPLLDIILIDEGKRSLEQNLTLLSEINVLEEQVSLKINSKMF
jgi:hypothetical protein